jgi:uncharacterized protein
MICIQQKVNREVTMTKRAVGKIYTVFCCLALFIYGCGKPTEKPIVPTYLDSLYRKANSGDPVAQCILGNHYDRAGKGNSDTSNALKWYRLAAAQGQKEAQYNLGRFYDNGYGVEESPDVALKWYRLAAEQGFPKAQFCVGLYYEKGVVVIKNYDEAAKWYRKAADEGIIPAQINLGCLYANGDFGVRDYEEAYFWLLLASITGDETAISNRDNIERRLNSNQCKLIQKKAINWQKRNKKQE